MGRIKIPYYFVRNGRGFWEPTGRAKRLGFRSVPCGPDGPSAWQIAEAWNRKWQAVRRGLAPAPNAPRSNAPADRRYEIEASRVYPRGSVGEAWQRYMRTPEWAKKPLSTRNKEWLPAWNRIRDMWGDVDPNTITFDMMSAWRNDPEFGLEARFGPSVAHKTLKIWRAFWKIMQGMQVVRGADPSLGVANHAPPPRSARFREGEVVRWTKAAWRAGYRGLACVMAVAWDTSFSPGDVRTLAAKHRGLRDGLIFFARTRKKTSAATVGTLSRRATALCLAYWQSLGVELTDEAFLFRNRSGAPYREDTLSDDFAAVRALVAPGDPRQLRDFRRSGALEAVAGGASPHVLSSKLANSIQTSNLLAQTYTPVDVASVDAADAARRVGRQTIRGTKEAQKFGTPQSEILNFPKIGRPKRS